eukprot:2847097-Rhodomonas_salina.4
MVDGAAHRLSQYRTFAAYTPCISLPHYRTFAAYTPCISKLHIAEHICLAPYRTPVREMV